MYQKICLEHCFQYFSGVLKQMLNLLFITIYDDFPSITEMSPDLYMPKKEREFFLKSEA